MSKRIAIIGKFYTEAFGLHCEEALNNMEHSVIRIDPEINFLQFSFLGRRIKNINKTLYQQVFHKIKVVRNFKSKDIYKRLGSSKVDLTLVLHDYLTEEEVSKIKKITKSPVAMWFPDHIQNIQKSMFFIAGYDFLFFKDKYMVDRFREEYGLNTFYLPQCCNPTRHNLVELTKEDMGYYACDITNAGNLYPSRAALYKRLRKYDFRLWGSPPAIWMDVKSLKSILMKKSVFNEEKSKAFSSAKIVLNNLHPAEINGVNKRTFEVAACGGFQITNYTDALPELFEIDKEVVVYNSFDELIEKIDYYLDESNEEERKKMIKAGYERTIKDHTYEKRLCKIIEITLGEKG